MKPVKHAVKHVIALDVGGTGMKAALIADDGTLLHEARRATGRDRGPDAVVETILEFAAELSGLGRERFGVPASRPASPSPASSTPRTGSPSTRRTWAGATYRCASC